MIKLYYAPGACSFVPHVALEAVKAATGEPFEPQPVRLHKGEQQSPEFLALNPNGQVPVLVVDGQVLVQIVAICDWIDRTYPQAGLLPAEPWARAQAMSKLAWMNNTVHPTFTHVFRPDHFTETDAARTEVRRVAAAQYRDRLARLDQWAAQASPLMLGERLSVLDAYCLVLLRWGGFAGIEPDAFPALAALVERVAQQPPVAAAMAREKLSLKVQPVV